MTLVLINPRNPVSLYGDYLWQPLAFGYVAAATSAHWTFELIDEQVEGAPDYGAVEGDMPTARAASAKTMPSRLKK